MFTFPESLVMPDIHELALSLMEPDGGFSIDLKTGEHITEGYAVSIEGHELPLKFATSLDLFDYVIDNFDALYQEHRVFGGWHDPESGMVDLDVSEVYPDLDTGMRRAVERNQLAVFDLVSGESVRLSDTAAACSATTRGDTRYDHGTERWPI